MYGPHANTGRRTGIVAFNCCKKDAKDLAMMLDTKGVAVRAGHFCTQPLHEVLKVPYSMRASVYFYNNKDEVDYFINELRLAIAS